MPDPADDAGRALAEARAWVLSLASSIAELIERVDVLENRVTRIEVELTIDSEAQA
jgi:hypothetical protein